MRRILIAVLMMSFCSFCFADEPATNAVYANYFADTAGMELYLRYLGALESAERVTKPNRTGQYAVKLNFRFSPKAQIGELFWDLPHVSFNRMRFYVWNPNPAKLPIRLCVRLVDNHKRGYLLSYFKISTAADPLPSSVPSAENGGWIRYEARLPDNLVAVLPQDEKMPSSAQIRERAFMHLTMSFAGEGNFPAKGQPVILFVDGLELYLDPD